MDNDRAKGANFKRPSLCKLFINKVLTSHQLLVNIHKNFYKSLATRSTNTIKSILYAPALRHKKLLDLIIAERLVEEQSVISRLTLNIDSALPKAVDEISVNGLYYQNCKEILELLETSIVVRNGVIIVSRGDEVYHITVNSVISKMLTNQTIENALLLREKEGVSILLPQKNQLFFLKVTAINPLRSHHSKS